MSDRTYFIVRRRFDERPSYCVSTSWPPVNMTREVKAQTIAAIELSDYGAQQSLSWLCELYECGGLQHSTLYRAPELPALKAEDARTNARYREEPIGKRHCQEAIAALYFGMFCRDLEPITSLFP